VADLRFLVTGLGNPGQEYHLTRHNIGFFFVDCLANSYSWQADILKMQGLYCQGRAFGAQIFLLKPQTYMNLSGECIRAFIDYFKIPLERILVLHDDLDLQAGRIKLVSKGGAGGHNGIRSISQHVGTLDFARMKIGIGRPFVYADGTSQPVDRFVLSKMNEDELRMFAGRTSLVEEAVSLFVREGISVCMNQINRRR
jgi:PTH1 family peptidyl-tRNA hydrolase